MDLVVGRNAWGARADVVYIKLCVGLVFVDFFHALVKSIEKTKYKGINLTTYKSRLLLFRSLELWHSRIYITSGLNK